MIAVYTYWEHNSRSVNGGFATSLDMARTMALSFEYSKKFFDKVILFTNQRGKELLCEKYEIQYDEVILLPDWFETDLHFDLWAFAKLYAYKTMADRGEAFIHLDNDVILWNPESVINSPLFFQNKEDLKIHSGYLKTLYLMGTCPVKTDLIYSTIPYACNCGIVGCTDKELMFLFEELYNAAYEFIFSDQNKEWWSSQDDKHSKNHVFEQYFLSCLIHKHGLLSKVKFLIDPFSYGIKQNKITHLWGSEKKNDSLMKKIKDRLYKEYPQYEKFESVKKDHKEIFSSIYRNHVWEKGSGGGSYPENTVEYREYLQSLVNDPEINTIVDLGCGDWQIGRLIDWKGKKVIGIDVVDGVIKENIQHFSSDNIEFRVDDIQTCDIPECDLLIVKDVFIHWTNQEIKNFFKRDIKAKKIIITNDDRVNGHNEDIEITGKFRDVDITKSPFHIKADIGLKWHSLCKTTHVVEYNS